MIPKQMNYGSKVESAPARSIRSNIQPNGGTGNYNPNDTITINIPTRANLLMVSPESYLKFRATISNNSGSLSSYRWDACGAHGLIQRIRIFSGSNLLEDIDNYNMLAKMLYDLQMPSDAVYNKFNVLSGTRADLVVRNGGTAINTDATDAGTTQTLANNIRGIITNNDLVAVQQNSGDLLGRSVTNGTTTAKDYCLNLISIVGSLCSDKYFPLFACTSAPLRVEIQLVSNLSNACAATVSSGNTFSLSNVEYVANLIELNDEAMSIITNSLGGRPLQFVIPEYRNYVNSLNGLPNNSTSGGTISIPAKFTSLKSLFVCQRAGNTAGNGIFPLSSIVNGLTSYQFRIGANVRHSKAPDNIPEIFSETLKAIGSIGDINYTPAIDLASFSLNTNTAMASTDLNLSGQTSGSFYIGIDLENYPNADKSTIFAGYNSNTDDIFFQPAFTNAPVAAPRYDCYALYDNLVVFENGTAYCKF
jgi:hypothetical protein